MLIILTKRIRKMDRDSEEYKLKLLHSKVTYTKDLIEDNKKRQEVLHQDYLTYKRLADRYYSTETDEDFKKYLKSLKLWEKSKVKKDKLQTLLRRLEKQLTK
jgi:hypothetical protein